MSNRTGRTRRLIAGGVLGLSALAFAPNTASAAISTDAFCANVPSGQSGFTDIAQAGVHQRNVECLKASGITSGTTPTTYSPQNNVSRGQMATFVANMIDRANQLDSAADPRSIPDLPTAAASADQFTDDENSVHENNINRLAQADIIQGTTATTFNPSGNVSRAQMATFIAEALEFIRGGALPEGADAFTDDETSVHEANINRLANADIVDGTSATTYTPNADVSRAQMASFIVQSLADLLADGFITALPPSGATGPATIRPELISAAIVQTITAGQATPAQPAGTYVRYTFDEAVGVQAAGLFHVYNANGTLADSGDAATVQPGGTAIVVRFDPINTATLAGALTVATVDLGAVADTQGNTNPEGDAAIGTEGTTTLTAGQTAGPDLVSVGNFRQGAAVGTTAVDFVFDEAATVAGAVGFSLVTTGNQSLLCTSSNNAASPSGGTVPGGSTTTTITVVCPNAGITGENPGGIPSSATNIARGAVDAAAVADSTAVANPLQTADVANSGNGAGPDLVSAVITQGTGANPDTVLYVFDANVTAVNADETLFNAYLNTGAQVNPIDGGLTISATDPRQVLAVFASNAALDNAVGASVEPGAVTATGVNNERDEVGAANSNSTSVTPGRTAGPDLVEVALTATNGFSPAVASYTFDTNVNQNPVDADFQLYTSSGTLLEAVACARGTNPDVESGTSGAVVTCRFGVVADAGVNSNVINAVLGTVDDGAVVAESGGASNPEGAARTTGGTGTPA